MGDNRGAAERINDPTTTTGIALVTADGRMT
jgi:hypothetical protein